MEDEEIRERMIELREQMRLIEWDREHSGMHSKDHIYKKLKKEYEQLNQHIQKGGDADGNTEGA